MGSTLPKAAHPLHALPLAMYPAEALRRAGVGRIIVVVGFEAEKVRSALGNGFDYVLQRQQKGTGHAFMQAAAVLADYRGDVVVTVGDAPLLTAGAIRRVLNHRRDTGAAAAMLTAVFPDRVPPYGRVIRDAEGSVIRIVEERDATAEERLIREVNASVYCFDAAIVLPLLGEIDRHNRAGEYYLTDIVEILRRHGHEVCAVQVDDPRTVLGVNTRSDLLEVSRIMQDLGAL